MGKTSTSRPPAARPDVPAAPPTDLFDRWLAHRSDEVAVGDEAPVKPATLPETKAVAKTAAKPVAEPATEPVERQAPDATAVGRAVVEALATPEDTSAEDSTPEDTTHADTTPGDATPGDSTPEPANSTPRSLGVVASAAPSEVTRQEEVATPPHVITPVAVTVQALAAAEVDSPDVISFAPKRRARRVLTVASGVAALATLAAALVAWQARSDASYVVVAGAAGLTLVLRSLRGRATGTQVSIHDGELRIVQGPSQHRFPLTASYPPIDVVGTAGERGWKVLIQRKGMGPYALTPSMVDPVAFTTALRRFRPNA